jgi:GH15 family glucan-1,4-alpha-glucosidase
LPARIEDYALLGDGETAALVSREGSVDWLCWPRFDSDACFAALLGNAKHGRWLLAPAMRRAHVRRRYRPGTLVLETEFETAAGHVTLIDFMPPRGSASDLVRIVVGRRGRVRMEMELIIRFGYGAVVPWVTQSHGAPTRLCAVAGPDRVTLHSQVAVRGEGPTTVSEFWVTEGEQVTLVLTHSPSTAAPPDEIDAMEALRQTELHWREWSNRCTYSGPYGDAVQRSLITLKALIHEPTGAIVAAPTTSLPEQIGGNRNWDYRYCWLRDATFTLLALMDAGYFDEARAWRDWLLRALAGNPEQAQILYGVGGERRLTEWEADWLPGFEQSRPVRIGNAAFLQRQLDIFGEVADAFHHARAGALAPSEAGWSVQCALTRHVEAIWEEPDEGIWEVRGPRQHFTYSKVMAWVALDRAIKSAESFKLAAPLRRWKHLRERIHAQICRFGFDAELGSFVQAYGSKQLDASLLLIPMVGFLPAHDPRIRGTLDAIGRDLKKDGLILRYHTSRTNDGLPPGEGAFLACSFWYVDNLVLAGREAQAREMFEQLLELQNDVGLLAEEYDPRERRQLGNFPQAFSHVALVDSALNLSGQRRQTPVEQRRTQAQEVATA